MSEPDLAKLSEAAELCGIPTDIIKMMAADAGSVSSSGARIHRQSAANVEVAQPLPRTQRHTGRPRRPPHR